MSTATVLPLFRLSRHSKETIAADVKTTADPTTVLPRWAFTELWDTDPTDDAVDGSWANWNPNTKKAQCLSPTLPNTASAVTLTKGRYYIWVKWDVGAEEPFKRIGMVEIY